MRACIGLGKSSKYIFYLFIVFISQFICDCLMSFNNNKNKMIRIFDFTPNIKSHYLIKDLIVYLSAFTCGILFYLLKNKIEMKKKGEISIRQHQKYTDKYFHLKKMPISLILIFIYFIYSFNNIIRTFLYSQIYYGEFWMLEISFIVLLMNKIFRIKIGSHQKVTVFIISGILFIFRIINCVLPRTHHNNCGTEEECKNKYLQDNNIFIIIKQKFGSYFFIPILFILYISIAIMRDYSWVKTKYLIDIKSVHFFKIFIYFGSVGAFFLFITVSFLTAHPCETLQNIKQQYNETSNTFTYYYNNTLTKISFSEKLCKFKEFNENTNELKIYYDNFFLFFNEYKKFSKEDKIEIFIIIPLYFIMNIIIKFSQIMMIRHFDPNMLLVTSNFYYFNQRLIEFIVNRGDENYLTHIQFFLYQIEELISIFANLIYMEIIELRFCQFDYDLKKNIQERGDMECIVLEDDLDNNSSEQNSFQNNTISEI